MIVRLACIVEGYGDVAAAPVLLRRLQQAIRADLSLEVSRPIRQGRHKLVKPGELERAVELAARTVSPQGAILLLVDADDDCPKLLAPKLLTRMRACRSDISSGVILAKCEFEAWFLASLDSLAGRRGLGQGLSPPADPEAVRNAKGAMSRAMSGTGAYSETVDQPAFADLFDLAIARRRSPSFDKCWREVERLLNELAPPGAA